MTQYDYDLFVIGAGSGGVRAGRIAAGLRRQGGHRRGVSRRRHLRDPRLRAQEAARLRQPLRRRLRGRARLRLDGARADLRLADADRRQGQGIGAPRSGLSHGARQGRGRADRRARDGRRAERGEACQVGPHRHGRRRSSSPRAASPGLPSRGPASSTSSPPTRRSICRACRRASSSPVAAISRWSSPASSRGSASRPPSSTAATKSCAASTRICATASPMPMPPRASDFHSATSSRIREDGAGLVGHLSNGTRAGSRADHVRHRPHAQYGRPRPRKGRRRARLERPRGRQRVFEVVGRQHLRRRRRDRPRGADARRHPRGPCVCRHRVRQQAAHDRARADPDRGVLDARGRAPSVCPSTWHASAAPSSTSTRPRSAR